MRTLFLTYDGLTDPLGQSQILPYQEGLAAAGYVVTILSLEKPKAFAKRSNEVQARVDAAGICWVHLPYSLKPPGLKTLKDFRRLRRKAFQLYRQTPFEVVHCRSYLAMLVGMALKKRFGCKLVFDMRGFWADERIDGGLWSLHSPVYGRVYRWFKKKEQVMVAQADRIVSLTEAGAREIETWAGYNANPYYRGQPHRITVIPCAADFHYFTLVTPEARAEGRRLLALPAAATVVNYLGSVGTWYCLPEMLRWVKYLQALRPETYFAVLTGEPPEMVFAAAEAEGVPRSHVRVRYAERPVLNTLLAASDVSLCFIKQAYSKLASSPTKLGELLAKGIPVVANTGVGDVAAIVEATGGGLVLRDFSEASLRASVEQFEQIVQLAPAQLRAQAEPYYALAHAQAKYVALYEALH